MRAVSEQDIRASFVNCSKGEAKRLPLPRDLDERRWDDLDFLGWRDLSAPDRSYIVTELRGELVGITLRFPSQQRGFLHRSMCSVCLTTHPGSGVSLMTARKRGQAAGTATRWASTSAPTSTARSTYAAGRRPRPAAASRSRSPSSSRSSGRGEARRVRGPARRLTGRRPPPGPPPRISGGGPARASPSVPRRRSRRAPARRPPPRPGRPPRPPR